jgi:hypothetical protein
MKQYIYHSTVISFAINAEAVKGGDTREIHEELGRRLTQYSRNEWEPVTINGLSSTMNISEWHVVLRKVDRGLDL